MTQFQKKNQIFWSIPMSAEKILENIDDMRKLFKVYGFENVRLFKGFLHGIDEKTFYLAVSLQAGQKDGLASAAKKQGLEKELKALLGFYVGISRDGDMEKNCLAEINQPRASVNLSELVENGTLKEKLESYFGKDWQFDIVDPYADRKPKLPTPEMLAFPRNVEVEMYRPVFSRPPNLKESKKDVYTNRMESVIFINAEQCQYLLSNNKIELINAFFKQHGFINIRLCAPILTYQYEKINFLVSDQRDTDYYELSRIETQLKQLLNREDINLIVENKIDDSHKHVILNNIINFTSNSIMEVKK